MLEEMILQRYKIIDQKVFWSKVLVETIFEEVILQR